MMPQLAWATGGTLTGDGTAKEPYQISDAADLKAFRDKVNEGATSIHAKLMDDINLNNETWTPISNASAIAGAFAGTFDGNGHTIKGLSVRASKSNQGLFGLINGATIKNLIVEGKVTSSNNYIGGIVGKVQAGTIENCGFSGSVTSTKTSSAYAGGIAGGTVNLSTITGCYNTGTITGYAGGILGYGKAAISDCYNTGAIMGTTRAGGIIGQFNGSATTNTAKNCYNTGELTLSSDSLRRWNLRMQRLCKQLLLDDRRKMQSEIIQAVRQILKKLIPPKDLVKKLGNSFEDGADGGYPILKWQNGATTEPAKPGNPHRILFRQQYLDGGRRKESNAYHAVCRL